MLRLVATPAMAPVDDDVGALLVVHRGDLLFVGAAKADQPHRRAAQGKGDHVSETLDPCDHFVEVTDLIGIGSGAKRERDIRPRIEAALIQLAG